MGTSCKSQHGQSEEQPSAHLGSDVDLKSCLLSFQVLEEVLFKLPASVPGGRAFEGTLFSHCGAARGAGVVQGQRKLLDHLR